MTIKSLLNDSELLAKVAEGDQRAFRLLYDKYNRKVYTHAAHLLHSEELAEEVMQEVFLKLWRMEKSLNEISNLEAYIKTLTRNRCLNVLRRVLLEAKADKLFKRDYVDAHNETEEEIILNDTRSVLNIAIGLLPQQQREVYLLCHHEGLKYEEAASRLNLSPLTVQTHMKRALKFLRGYLKANTDIAALLILLKLF